MPELDTIRGIAILGVLFCHGFEWQYGNLHFGRWADGFIVASGFGWLGVNLFFVLSGFLITGILLDSKEKPEFYRRFYTRRALRILPAYYLLLALLLILRSSQPAFVGLSFVYLANVSELFGVATGYGPLWSLAVEEHFYILWPAFVRNLTKERLALLSCAIVAGTPILRAIGFIRGDGGLDWYTWFVADGLAAGSLLAIVLRSSVTRIQVQRLCAGLLLGGLVIGAIGKPFGITTRARLIGAALEFSVVNVIFAGVLLLFLLLGTSSASSRRRYVNSTLLRFFGYTSYGLYLDHVLAFRIYMQVCRRYWPTLVPASGRFDLVVLKFVLAGGGAIAAAYLSRRYFEERFLRMKDRTACKPNAEEAAKGQIAGAVLPVAS